MRERLADLAARLRASVEQQERSRAKYAAYRGVLDSVLQEHRANPVQRTRIVVGMWRDE